MTSLHLPRCAFVWALALLGCADATTAPVDPQGATSVSGSPSASSDQANASSNQATVGSSGSQVSVGQSSGGGQGSGGAGGAGQGLGGQGGGDGRGGNGPGAGGSAIASGCASSAGNEVFCEGFEDTLGPEWSAYDGTYQNGCAGHSVGVGQRDTTRSRSGLASWHASVDYVDLESCQAELRRAVTLPSPDAFVRMFVYLPATSVTPSITSFELNMLSESHGGFGAIGPTFFSGTLGVEGYGDVAPSPARDTSPFPTDRWVCVEWQLHQGTQPTFTAWRDGTQVIAPADVSVTTMTEPLDGIFFGIYGYNNMGAVDVWLDDVALSDRRVGCTGP